jgi:antitoxin component YwqK of YwqJK toxin-antitoxin module
LRLRAFAVKTERQINSLHDSGLVFLSVYKRINTTFDKHFNPGFLTDEMNTDTDNSRFQTKPLIVRWILNNPNSSIVSVFVILGICGLIFQNNGDGAAGEIGGEQGAEGRYHESKQNGGGINGFESDSTRDHVSTPYVQVAFFDNGDTSTISYYNAQGKRTKYVEKDLNGDTSRIYETRYTDSGQIDEKTSYYENGNTSSKTRSLNDGFDGEQILYYENGNIKLKKNYSLGKQINAAYYSKSGKLVRTENTDTLNLLQPTKK